MKLIRALWGDKKEIKEEIPTKPDDSVVYVWGNDNLNFLKSLGYKTRFVEDTLESDYKFKLISLDLGFQEFKECIFLDWDCKQIKPIDNLEFNSPSMPLYSYPKEYEFSNPNITKQVKTFGWELDDFYVLPNACCITVKGFNLGKELLSIHKKYNFDTLVEEFAFKVFTNSTLDEYIEMYDSPYLYGRESSQYFWVDGKKVNTAKKLNEYIGKKQIKFIHE